LNLPFPDSTVGAPRAVPMMHVFAWYEEAMRLFKCSPLMWCLLGIITVACEFGLQLIPGVGAAAAKIIVPVIECGMLIGAASLDNDTPLQLGYSVVTFTAKAGTFAAVVAAGLIVFAAEAITAYALAGINLLASDDASKEMSMRTVAAVLTAGTLISLPVTFVPFAALLGHASFTAAFGAGVRGFVLNVIPLLLFGALALVLIALGVLTYGVGLIAVFPLLSAASYAAWKDVFAVTRGSA
jgi:hypothetical protein